MVINTSYNVFALQATTHGGIAALLKIECTLNSSAAACFVQLHDARTAPSNGAVPKKSWPASASAQLYKEFKFGEGDMANGIYVCVSTTEATLTLGTGNNKFSMVSVEINVPDYPFGTSEATGSAAAFVTVWNEASGPKRLFRFEATNLEATACYILLFAKDTPVDGDVPILGWPIAATGDSAGGDTIMQNFGDGGYSPERQSASAAITNGCTLCLSETADVLTTSGLSAGANFYAEYKTALA